MSMVGEFTDHIADGFKDKRRIIMCVKKRDIWMRTSALYEYIFTVNK